MVSRRRIVIWHGFPNLSSPIIMGFVQFRLYVMHLATRFAGTGRIYFIRNMEDSIVKPGPSSFIDFSRLPRHEAISQEIDRLSEGKKLR